MYELDPNHTGDVNEEEFLLILKFQDCLYDHLFDQESINVIY